MKEMRGKGDAELRAYLQLFLNHFYRGEKGHLAILALSRLSLDRGMQLWVAKCNTRKAGQAWRVESARAGSGHAT